jgi:cytosine deaminase
MPASPRISLASAVFDRVLRQARIAGQPEPVDIAIAGERIARIAPGIASDAPSEDLGGRFACAGFVETHVHLDKACILDRCAICEGTLAEAVAQSARAKAGFTEEDVLARAEHVMARAIGHGTTVMRSFCEVDPRAGLRSFDALRALRAAHAHAVDLEICAFAQDGLTQEMETYRLLDAACAAGADLVGGCPYTDPDPARHIALVFDLADRYGLRVDFHLDFNLAPESSNLDAVLRETARRGYGGRVSVGHVTQLSAQPTAAVDRIAARMADHGVALTVLPATDLFLMGRGIDRLVPRGVAPAHRMAELGVTTSIATNNVMNPFTPFGDASLLRMANLYANILQVAQDDAVDRVFAMITADAARLLGRDAHRLAEGGPADIVVLDAPDARTALREIAPTWAGWKRGRPNFRRPPVVLAPPPA